MKILFSTLLCLMLSGCAISGALQPIRDKQRVEVPTPMQPKELELFVMWEPLGFVPLVGFIPLAEREDAAAKIEAALHDEGFDVANALHADLVAEMSKKGIETILTTRDIKKKFVPTFLPVKELSAADGTSLVLDVKIVWYGFYASTGGADYKPSVSVAYRMVDVQNQKELWKRVVQYNGPGTDTFGLIKLEEKPLKEWPDREAIVNDIPGARADLGRAISSVTKAIANQLVQP